MLVDCFTYFNEKELLELRVNLLKDYVDGFIIADANRTHRGDPKEFTAVDTIRELGLPEEKIQVLHVELPDFETIPDPWVRERGQRDAIGVGLHMLPDDAIFIISDCDEIVNPEYLFKVHTYLAHNPDDFVNISMSFHVARADRQLVSPTGEEFEWISPIACTVGNFKKMSTLSVLRSTPAARTIGCRDAGWHFSWMGDSSRLQEKLQGFAHCWDVIGNAHAPLFSEEMRERLANYNPEVGGNDPLGRDDHILAPYPVEKLPSVLFELDSVREYLLPRGD